MAKPKLTDEDFCRTAKLLRCEVAAIKAVAEVESRGEGFYANGFPTILFERHVFRKWTNGKYNTSHPELSGPQGNYGKAGANQRRKFNEAYALNPVAAIKACSWGKFQVMGFNYAVAGFSSPTEMLEAMQESEGRHLDAFVGFVMGNHLADEIRNHDWAGFAYSYNGAGYKANHYDTAMARAYVKFAKENIDCSKISAAPVTKPASETTSESSQDETVESAPPPIQQNADQIINTAPPPAPIEPTTPQDLPAPAAMGSVQTAGTVTFLGFAVPTFIVAAWKAITDLIDKGFIKAEDIGTAVLNLITNNGKYILIGVGLVILVIIVKKVERAVIFIVTIITHAIPSLNSITVVAPEPVAKKPWWRF